jgi:hypothetical protein
VCQRGSEKLKAESWKPIAADGIPADCFISFSCQSGSQACHFTKQSSRLRAPLPGSELTIYTLDTPFRSERACGQTSTSRRHQRIEDALGMGSESYVSKLLASVDS